MEVVGHRIRAERERHGWDQAQLAKRLDTGQQTVSRWERGESRPRREMVARLARLFGLPVRDLLADAGYAPASDRPRPVQPRLANLPLGELSPEQLEYFVADLAQMLYPDSHASRFGSQGHKQSGIDVLVQDGAVTRATFQCKRHRRFGPQQVRDAVSASSVSAQEHFLVLSRPASPGARQEMAKHAGWTLLDTEDLSRRVRNHLSREQAVRLVDSHFPGWREPLLGVSEPGVWETPEEFYRLTGRGDFYTHKWALVGREPVVDEITSLTTSEAHGRLALIVGRGGIGKTRVLREIATRCKSNGVPVRFLSTNSAVGSQQFELLPESDKMIVIVDDVHERNDIAEIVSGVARNRPKAIVLLALRPYGLSQLSSQLRHVGLHASTLPTWQLSDLTPAESESLAREVLGNAASEAVVRRLGRLTTDCPLITVVGAVLIARASLDPALLESDESVRTEILQAFRDALVADPLDGDADLRRAVLEGIAVLQPFRLDDTVFQSALEKLTGTPFDRTVSHIRALEDAGVLLRRGKALRVVPDLLGDVVLAGAVFEERSGVSTGYIERARAASDGAALQNVFLNASRVDWQVRREHAGIPSLAASLWTDLGIELKKAGIRGRETLLSLLARVAYYQPDRALALVRWTIDNPTDVVETVEDFFARSYAPSYEDVLQDLPPILKVVAFSLDHLPVAVDILWDLAQSDSRPINQNPDHAIRILQDLASYQPGKPLGYNAAMVDAAERWTDQTDSTTWVHSPFDILDQLLATEGSEDSFDGHSISFRPFAINIESTTPVRQRVIELALREARTTDAKRAVRAVLTLENALRYPNGLFGRPVSDEERARWTPRFIDLIKSIGDLSRDPSVDPIVAVAVRKALKWHAEYSKHGTGDVAREVLANLPRTIPAEVALVLHDGWGNLLGGRRENYEAMATEKQARLDTIAVRVLDELSGPDILSLLSERLNVERRAFRAPPGNPGPFCLTLFAKQPLLSLQACEEVVTNPSTVLVQVLPFALAHVAQSLPEELISSVDALVETGSVVVRRAVAEALGWSRGRRSVADGEMEWLIRFATDEDVWVRMSAVRAAQMLGQDYPDEAVRIITAVRFNDEPMVAEEVCSAFGKAGSIQWDSLSEMQRESLMEQLIKCPSIDGYNIVSFLSDVSARDAVATVDLLRLRIEYYEAGAGPVYVPLPFHWDTALCIDRGPQYLSLLRQVRDWIAEKPESWPRVEYGGNLFRLIAAEFDPSVLAVLEEAMHSGRREHLQALAAILREAPREIVWDNPDFVARSLAAASQFGEDAVREVGGALHSAVISGVRTGTPGRPFPQDLEQREKSVTISERLSVGSLEHRFYRSLAESAEQSINWSAERDESLSDGRDW